MRAFPLAAAVALAVPLLAAAPADACSVTPDYRVPTSLELAANADMILLGIAEGEANTEGEAFDREVIVRPTALLKGEARPAEVRIRGYLSDDPRLVAASNPRDLFNPNPGALIGGCTRYIFRRGMLLLLFLERDDGGQLRLANSPFARSAEDVPSPDAPWVKAVRLYAEIAALPERERRAALAARRDALRAMSGDADAALVADDIDRQIRRRRIPPYD
ncbi:MAG TPA: hypothetical protein VEW71_09215 [Allosphingosinicella sp.]|nr:hypothetical protein [Allosphingosinicella sp.]